LGNRGRHRRRGCFIRIKQFFKRSAVGNGSIGNDDFAHELVALVDAGVKLVAEVVLVVLLLSLGIVPPLTLSASLCLLRWTGAHTSEASMIWPQRAG